MFNLVQNNSFKRLVTINLPDGGTASLHAIFICKTQTELAEIEAKKEGDSGLLRATLTGWEGFNDFNGNPITFDEETKNQAINIPFVRTALAMEYMRAIVGAPNEQGARLKN